MTILNKSLNNVFAYRKPTRFLFWGVIITIFSVFSRELTVIPVAGFDYDYISYTFFIISFIIFLFGKGLPKLGLLLCLFVFITYSINLLIIGYPLIPFFKYFLPITIIYLSIYRILKQFDPIKIFELYVEFAFLSTIFGLIQLLLKLFFGYKLLSVFSSIAIDSVAGEPSHYAVILVPAVVYSIMNFRKYTWKALFMLVVFFLTFKLTAYFAFALSIFIAYFNLLHLLILIPVFYFTYSNYIITDPQSAYRILPIYNYMLTGEIPNFLHGTPLSFISNLEVAFYSLSKNPLFGVGFGGHETSYFEYFRKNPFIGLDYLFGLNSRGGHSLTIRILSETGVVGFLAYVIFLLRCLILDKSSPYRAVSIACISHFIGKTIKLSSYIDYGTSFFFIVLLLNFQAYKSRN